MKILIQLKFLDRYTYTLTVRGSVGYHWFGWIPGRSAESERRLYSPSVAENSIIIESFIKFNRL